MTRRAIGVSERPPLLQTIPLSLQHLFAMFGATVLVPVLFHINPATVLLFNGIGTLLYLFICKGKIPAYLGSSFAFISPVLLLLPLGYEVALGGFIMCGVLFCIVSFIVKKSRYRLAGRDVPACGDGRNRCRHRPGAGRCGGKYGRSAAARRAVGGY